MYVSPSMWEKRLSDANEDKIGMATYLLLWPEDGRMQKDDIRRIFDGSIFYEIAARREKKLKQ